MSVFSPSMSNDRLLTLRERVRRIERPTATAHGVLPFGLAAIDRALPGGGLTRGALHEILGSGGDEEDGALAAAFAACIVASLLMMQRWHRVVVPCPVGSLRARPCRAGSRPFAAGGGADRARRRDPVGDGGGVAHIRRRCGGRRNWCLAGGGEPPIATGRRTLRRHCFCIAALAQWRAGSARTQSSERRRDALAHLLPAVAACPLFLNRQFPSVSLSQYSSPRKRGEGAGGRPCGGTRQERIEGEEPGVGKPRWRVELLRCRGGEPGMLGGGGAEREGGGCDGFCIFGCRTGRSTGCAGRPR